MLLPLILTSCAVLSPQPPNVNNICDIFADKRGWYNSARQAENRWKIPTALIFAFINQESSFKSNARPPRKKFFGFIPWQRPTSAYGYAQATKPTWEDYKKETGKIVVFRNNFKDSADFIGWYNNKSANTLKISRNDAYRLYLAYHEGRGGYRKQSYLKKKWLLAVARKVEKQKNRYMKQLNTCRS